MSDTETNTKTIPEVIDDLKTLITHARLAVSMAQIENPTAAGMAGIGWMDADGSGKLVIQFDSGPFLDDLERVIRHTKALDEKGEAAYHLGAEAMRSACRDIADEHREAIDAVTLSYSPPDTGFRDRPPTIEEVRALANTSECGVGDDGSLWMSLHRIDRTVQVDIILFNVCNYESDIYFVTSQGAVAFRPITNHGDPFPWPVLP